MISNTLHLDRLTLAKNERSAIVANILFAIMKIYLYLT